MRSALIPLLALGLTLGASARGTPAPGSWPDRLGAVVGKLAREGTGNLSLFVESVDTGETFSLDAQTPTYVSSTIKLVVALATLHAVDGGTLSLERSFAFRAEDERDGVGPLRWRRPGGHFPLRAWLELMLERSDNAAADRLIGLVGGVSALDAEVARRGVGFGPFASLLEERRMVYRALSTSDPPLTPQEVRSLGFDDSLDARAEHFSRLRGHHPPWTGEELARGFDALYASGYNATSAAELGKLLAQVSRCSGLSEQSCHLLVRLLRRCRTGAHRIKAGLPPGTPWAHKTGTQFHRACDSGFFTRPDGHPVVMVACARDFTDLAKTEALFAELGSASYKAFMPGAEQAVTEAPRADRGP